MKAKVKATGEIIEVKPYGHKSLRTKYNVYIDNSYREYIDSQLEFSTEIDWEQRRYEIAKDIMSAQLSDGESAENNSKEVLAKWAVVYADALIKELKKGGEK